MQTLVAMRPSGPAPRWRSEAWPTPDGDDLRLAFAGPVAADAPLVLLLHGLEGSRASPYAVEAAWRAAALGLRLCVLEFRSCGGVLNRARRTYHSGETGDLALVVAGLVSRFPAAPLFVLAYSLGANVLLKWLGEVGDGAPAALRAAAAVSAPYDLARCAERCDRRYGGVIARHFLRTLIPTALAKERQFPGCCDPEAVRACRTFRAFDDLVTAPLHGFRDAAHYYATQSCGPLLPSVRRPTLLLAAEDDPLVPADVLPHAAVAGSRFLLPSFHRHGGHVAFVAGGAPWRPRRWAEAQVLRFFAQHGAPAEAVTG